ncbi:MAG: LysM peptidoglycan-binding domain-containing protein [Muribaculaceae bacterium]
MSLTANALDLPVKTVNNTRYYYYTAKKGDTVLSIARKIGVTRSDILLYNPGVADGVSEGVTIYLPVDQFADVASPEELAVTSADVAASSPLPEYSGPTFRYKVQKGETLFGLAHRFNCTPDQIIALNPWADQGIRNGDILTIPGSITGLADASAATPQRGETPSRTEQPVQATPVRTEPQVEPEEESEDTVIVPPAESDYRINMPQPAVTEVVEDYSEAPVANVTLLLPLMLNGDEHAKQARSATEFVRGFLMALDERKDSCTPIHLTILDTEGSAERTDSLLQTPAVRDAAVVIPSDDAFARMHATGFASEGRVLNLFAVQDTTYKCDTNIYQANIPAQMMYEGAADTFLDTFMGYTPVFLICRGGRSEKIAFTDYLRSRYEAAGIQTVDIQYSNMLTQSELADLDPEGMYVFIPASGALNEFNKFAPALLAYREERADPTSIALVGYPDWTAFRSDAKTQLHRLDAVIYSRFYADDCSPSVISFQYKFQQLYGNAPADLVPSQAMLGYDTANYLITGLSVSNGRLVQGEDSSHNGLQSSFEFDYDQEVRPGCGPVNTALYIITFNTDNNVTVEVR